MIELVTLKTKIEQLPKKQQVEILKIIIKSDVALSENNNGTFFNLSSLNSDQIEHINNYITYVTEQEESLQEMETVKDELCEAYFNGVKNSVKEMTHTNIGSYESA